MRFLDLARASLLTAKRCKIDWYGNVLMPILEVLPVIIAIWFGNKLGLLNFSSIIGTENLLELRFRDSVLELHRVSLEFDF